MHLIRFSRPSPEIVRFIRYYGHREAQLESSILIHPVPARSEHMLDFEFGGTIGVQSLSTGITHAAQTAALIGLQTHRRTQLLVQGNIESFIVFFQPAALNLMFGLAVGDITNSDHDASGVLGCSILDLTQRLGNGKSFLERVEIADKYFAHHSSRAPALNAMEVAADEIRRNYGACRIDSLARTTGLSIRQFQRSFQERVGIPPKLYARIVRFESALAAKAASKHLSWTTLAQQFGYHDQMHMVHDFQQLSAGSPSEILRHVAELFSFTNDRASDEKHTRLLL